MGLAAGRSKAPVAPQRPQRYPCRVSQPPLTSHALPSASLPRRLAASALRIALALVAVAVAGIAFVGALTWMPGQSHRGKLPPLDPTGIAIRDRLAADVAHLAVTIGERSMRMPDKLDESARWVRAQFEAAGWTVRDEPYAVRDRTVRNLIAERLGTRLPAEIVLLGAHYDSVERAPGADDNASGVAAMLEVARQLRDVPLDRTVRLQAFVNEEPPWFRGPLMGSRIAAKAARARGDDLVHVIILDSIGFYCDDACQAYPPLLGWFLPAQGDFIAFVTKTADWWRLRDVVGRFRAAAAMPSEGVAAPRAVPGIDFSDHAAFWDAGYPGVLVTDAPTYRNPHYHTGEDLPADVDFDRLARVAAGLTAVVRGLAVR